ncbi:MAG: hypothetical protein FWG57_08915 [Endomicrobia bacterium]|nr:hypothetical protein [Endomicrobiia bacterium]
MNIKKFTSLLTMLCFLVTFAGQNLAWATQETSSGKIGSAEFKKIFENIPLIPTQYGKVTSVSDLGGKSIVVNIQDLHCHPEAQRNISRIIEILDKNYKVRSVHVEGAYGKISTEWLSGIQDKQLRDSLVEQMLNDGRLNAAEYYAVKNDKKDFLFGIENKQIHEDNIKRLAYILDKQEIYDELLAKIQNNLNFWDSKYTNIRNKRFNKTLEKYHSGKMKTDKFYAILNKYANKINSNPEKYNNVLPINTSNYPNIQNFMFVTKANADLNMKKVQLQLQAILSYLKAKLPPQAFQIFLDETDNFANIDRLAAALSNFSTMFDINLNAHYSDLNTFFKLQTLSRNINPLDLIAEERHLIERLRTALSYDQTENEIAFMSDFYGYFRDYMKNTLMSDDLAYLAARLDKFRTLYAKYAFVNDLKSVEQDFEILNAFHKINEDRNDIFSDNIFKYWQPKDTGSAKSIVTNNADDIFKNAEEIIVVVTGGFHSPGLKDILAKKGITDIIITPTVTTDTKRAEEIYEEIIRQQSIFLRETLAFGIASQAISQEQFEILVTAGISLMKDVRYSPDNIKALMDNLKSINPEFKIENDTITLPADKEKIKRNTVKIINKDGRIALDLRRYNNPAKTEKDYKSAMDEVFKLIRHSILTPNSAIRILNPDIDGFVTGFINFAEKNRFYNFLNGDGFEMNVAAFIAQNKEVKYIYGINIETLGRLPLEMQRAFLDAHNKESEKAILRIMPQKKNTQQNFFRRAAAIIIFVFMYLSYSPTTSHSSEMFINREEVFIPRQTPVNIAQAGQAAEYQKTANETIITMPAQRIVESLSQHGYLQTPSLISEKNVRRSIEKSNEDKRQKQVNAAYDILQKNGIIEPGKRYPVLFLENLDAPNMDFANFDGRFIVVPGKSFDKLNNEQQMDFLIVKIAHEATHLNNNRELLLITDEAKAFRATTESLKLTSTATADGLKYQEFVARAFEFLTNNQRDVLRVFDFYKEEEDFSQLYYSDVTVAPMHNSNPGVIPISDTTIIIELFKTDSKKDIKFRFAIDTKTNEIVHVEVIQGDSREIFMPKDNSILHLQPQPAPQMTMVWLKWIFKTFNVSKPTQEKWVKRIETPIMVLGDWFPKVQKGFLFLHSEEDREAVEKALSSEGGINSQTKQAFRAAKSKINFPIIKQIADLAVKIRAAFIITAALHIDFNNKETERVNEIEKILIDKLQPEQFVSLDFTDIEIDRSKTMITGFTNSNDSKNSEQKKMDAIDAGKPVLISLVYDRNKTEEGVVDEAGGEKFQDVTNRVLDNIVEKFYKLRIEGTAESFKEMIKNAFIHGNNANLSKKIFIYFDGKDILIINEDSSKVKNLETTSNISKSGMYGLGYGSIQAGRNVSMKWARINIGNDKNIFITAGTPYTIGSNGLEKKEVGEQALKKISQTAAWKEPKELPRTDNAYKLPEMKEGGKVYFEGYKDSDEDFPIIFISKQNGKFIIHNISDGFINLQNEKFEIREENGAYYLVTTHRFDHNYKVNITAVNKTISIKTFDLSTGKYDFERIGNNKENIEYLEEYFLEFLSSKEGKTYAYYDNEESYKRINEYFNRVKTLESNLKDKNIQITKRFFYMGRNIVEIQYDNGEKYLFYQSRRGTGLKNEGNWYPLIGISMESGFEDNLKGWFVKFGERDDIISGVDDLYGSSAFAHTVKLLAEDDAKLKLSTGRGIANQSDQLTTPSTVERLAKIGIKQNVDENSGQAAFAFLVFDSLTSMEIGSDMDALRNERQKNDILKALPEKTQEAFKMLETAKKELSENNFDQVIAFIQSQLKNLSKNIEFEKIDITSPNTLLLIAALELMTGYLLQNPQKTAVFNVSDMYNVLHLYIYLSEKYANGLLLSNYLMTKGASGFVDVFINMFPVLGHTLAKKAMEFFKNNVFLLDNEYGESGKIPQIFLGNLEALYGLFKNDDNADNALIRLLNDSSLKNQDIIDKVKALRIKLVSAKLDSLLDKKFNMTQKIPSIDDYDDAENYQYLLYKIINDISYNLKILRDYGILPDESKLKKAFPEGEYEYIDILSHKNDKDFLLGVIENKENKHSIHQRLFAAMYFKANREFDSEGGLTDKDIESLAQAYRENINSFKVSNNFDLQASIMGTHLLLSRELNITKEHEDLRFSRNYKNLFTKMSSAIIVGDPNNNKKIAANETLMFTRKYVSPDAIAHELGHYYLYILSNYSDISMLNELFAYTIQGYIAVNIMKKIPFFAENFMTLKFGEDGFDEQEIHSAAKGFINSISAAFKALNYPFSLIHLSQAIVEFAKNDKSVYASQSVFIRKFLEAYSKFLKENFNPDLNPEDFIRTFSLIEPDLGRDISEKSRLVDNITASEKLESLLNDKIKYSKEIPKISYAPTFSDPTGENTAFDYQDNLNNTVEEIADNLGALYEYNNFDAIPHENIKRHFPNIHKAFPNGEYDYLHILVNRENNVYLRKVFNDKTKELKYRLFAMMYLKANGQTISDTDTVSITNEFEKVVTTFEIGNNFDLRAAAMGTHLFLTKEFKFIAVNQYNDLFKKIASSIIVAQAEHDKVGANSRLIFTKASAVIDIIAHELGHTYLEFLVPKLDIIISKTDRTFHELFAFTIMGVIVEKLGNLQPFKGYSMNFLLYSNTEQPEQNIHAAVGGFLNTAWTVFKELNYIFSLPHLAEAIIQFTKDTRYEDYTTQSSLFTAFLENYADFISNNFPETKTDKEYFLNLFKQLEGTELGKLILQRKRLIENMSSTENYKNYALDLSLAELKAAKYISKDTERLFQFGFHPDEIEYLYIMKNNKSPNELKNIINDSSADIKHRLYALAMIREIGNTEDFSELININEFINKFKNREIEINNIFDFKAVAAGLHEAVMSGKNQRDFFKDSANTYRSILSLALINKGNIDRRNRSQYLYVTDFSEYSLMEAFENLYSKDAVNPRVHSELRDMLGKIFNSFDALENFYRLLTGYQPSDINISKQNIAFDFLVFDTLTSMDIARYSDILDTNTLFNELRPKKDKILSMVSEKYRTDFKMLETAKNKFEAKARGENVSDEDIKNSFEAVSDYVKSFASKDAAAKIKADLNSPDSFLFLASVDILTNYFFNPSVQEKSFGDLKFTQKQLDYIWSAFVELSKNNEKGFALTNYINAGVMINFMEASNNKKLNEHFRQSQSFLLLNKNLTLLDEIYPGNQNIPDSLKKDFIDFFGRAGKKIMQFTQLEIFEIIIPRKFTNPEIPKIMEEAVSNVLRKDKAGEPDGFLSAQIAKIDINPALRETLKMFENAKKLFSAAGAQVNVQESEKALNEVTAYLQASMKSLTVSMLKNRTSLNIESADTLLLLSGLDTLFTYFSNPDMPKKDFKSESFFPNRPAFMYIWIEVFTKLAKNNKTNFVLHDFIYLNLMKSFTNITGEQRDEFAIRTQEIFAERINFIDASYGKDETIPQEIEDGIRNFFFSTYDFAPGFKTQIGALEKLIDSGAIKNQHLLKIMRKIAEDSIQDKKKNASSNIDAYLNAKIEFVKNMPIVNTTASAEYSFLLNRIDNDIADAIRFMTENGEEMNTDQRGLFNKAFPSNTAKYFEILINRDDEDYLLKIFKNEKENLKMRLLALLYLKIKGSPDKDVKDPAAFIKNFDDEILSMTAENNYELKAILMGTHILLMNNLGIPKSVETEKFPYGVYYDTLFEKMAAAVIVNLRPTANDKGHTTAGSGFDFTIDHTQASYAAHELFHNYLFILAPDLLFKFNSDEIGTLHELFSFAGQGFIDSLMGKILPYKYSYLTLHLFSDKQQEPMGEHSAAMGFINILQNGVKAASAEFMWTHLTEAILKFAVSIKSVKDYESQKALFENFTDKFSDYMLSRPGIFKDFNKEAFLDFVKNYTTGEHDLSLMNRKNFISNRPSTDNAGHYADELWLTDLNIAKNYDSYSEEQLKGVFPNTEFGYIKNVMRHMKNANTLADIANNKDTDIMHRLFAFNLLTGVYMADIEEFDDLIDEFMENLKNGEISITNDYDLRAALTGLNAFMLRDIDIMKDLNGIERNEQARNQILENISQTFALIMSATFINKGSKEIPRNLYIYLTDTYANSIKSVLTDQYSVFSGTDFYNNLLKKVENLPIYNKDGAVREGTEQLLNNQLYLENPAKVERQKYEDSQARQQSDDELANSLSEIMNPKRVEELPKAMSVFEIPMLANGEGVPIDFVISEKIGANKIINVNGEIKLENPETAHLFEITRGINGKYYLRSPGSFLRFGEKTKAAPALAQTTRKSRAPETISQKDTDLINFLAHKNMGPRLIAPAVFIMNLPKIAANFLSSLFSDEAKQIIVNSHFIEQSGIVDAVREFGAAATLTTEGYVNLPVYVIKGQGIPKDYPELNFVPSGRSGLWTGRSQGAIVVYADTSLDESIAAELASNRKINTIVKQIAGTSANLRNISIEWIEVDHSDAQKAITYSDNGNVQVGYNLFKDMLEKGKVAEYNASLRKTKNTDGFTFAKGLLHDIDKVKTREEFIEALEQQQKIGNGQIVIDEALARSIINEIGIQRFLEFLNAAGKDGVHVFLNLVSREVPNDLKNAGFAGHILTNAEGKIEIHNYALGSVSTVTKAKDFNTLEELEEQVRTAPPGYFMISSSQFNNAITSEKSGLFISQIIEAISSMKILKMFTPEKMTPDFALNAARNFDIKDMPQMSPEQELEVAIAYDAGNYREIISALDLPQSHPISVYITKLESQTSQMKEIDKKETYDAFVSGLIEKILTAKALRKAHKPNGLQDKNYEIILGRALVFQIWENAEGKGLEISEKQFTSNLTKRQAENQLYAKIQELMQTAFGEDTEKTAKVKAINSIIELIPPIAEERRKNLTKDDIKPDFSMKDYESILSAA